jgi:type VI secretion system Hcp family effector
MTATAPTIGSSVNMAGHHTILNCKDIPGFSKFATDAIDLKTFQFEVGHGTEGGAGQIATSGRLALSGVVITKNVDKSTPLFFQALTQNTMIKEIGVFLYRNAPKDGTAENWVTVTLTNVNVTNQKFMDADKEKGGEAVPIEEITFHCEKVEISHNSAKKVASYQFTMGGKVS